MYDNLIRYFKDRIKSNYDLTFLNTLKIMSQAKYFIDAESADDLQMILKLASQDKFPFLIIGGGSNIAFNSPYYELLVIRNKYIKKEIVTEDDDYCYLKISSGYPISRLVKETTEIGLSGFEYHMGLPGTLGGAIYMNSKWTKPVSYLGDNLVEADILTKAGGFKKVPASYFKFEYGYSYLQETGEIFLSGVFKLRKEDPVVLKKRAQESLDYRKNTHPYGVPTGGCFFKNISLEEMSKNGFTTTSAGSLIDKCGLKGYRIGSFVVSTKHANFIINEGDGKPEDLRKLISYVKETVFKNFKVLLKEEVLQIV